MSSAKRMSAADADHDGEIRLLMLDGGRRDIDPIRGASLPCAAAQDQIARMAMDLLSLTPVELEAVEAHIRQYTST